MISSSFRRSIEFTIAEPQEFFALVDLPDRRLSGRLARRPRARSGAARARERARDALAVRAFAQALRRRSRSATYCEAATVYAHKTLSARGVVMLLPEDGELDARLGLAAAGRPQSRRNRRRALGVRQERVGGLEDRHAAQRALPVPPDGDDARRRRRLRLRAGGPVRADFADARSCAEPHPRPGRDRRRSRAAGQGFAANRRAGGQREAAHHVARLALA